MQDKEYDVVIVGSGIAGSVMAKTLTQAGKTVLLLEAGLTAGYNKDKDGNRQSYLEYLNTYYEAGAKTPNSPYPNVAEAKSIDVLDIRFPVNKEKPYKDAYLIQKGDFAFGSDCMRGPGGTTLHWLGSTPRMLPNDFEKAEAYFGVKWPVTYDEMMRYYEMAELEIGVSGDVADLKKLDETRDNYGANYNFPMKKIPQSYLDSVVMKALKKESEENLIDFDGKKVKITFSHTPQGRNSIPNENYKPIDVIWDGAKLELSDKKYWDRKKHAVVELEKGDDYQYMPLGAVWDPNTGQRCEGNASCVPICPVQAKYNALKSLARADHSKLTVQTQSVVSRVLFEKENGPITGIEYKTYFLDDTLKCETKIAKGKVYVLGASAIENAKILLASKAANSSTQVGCNIMDHLCYLTWGYLPENGYPYRGPGSTTNIHNFRDGDFRKKHSAWICPVDNWGWAWPTFSPGSDLDELLKANLFGKTLRDQLAKDLPKQLLLHYECEQSPQKENRVTIDENYKDQFGNYKPVVTYNITKYEILAFEAAKKVNDQLFKAGVIEDHTADKPMKNVNCVERDGKYYNFFGAGHIVGTHRMGDDPKHSVVNKNSQCWDHENLYLVGCGNMPTLGTSNPTLTMLALTFKAAEAILQRK